MNCDGAPEMRLGCDTPSASNFKDLPNFVLGTIYPVISMVYGVQTSEPDGPRPSTPSRYGSVSYKLTRIWIFGTGYVLRKPNNKTVPKLRRSHLD